MLIAADILVFIFTLRKWGLGAARARRVGIERGTDEGRLQGAGRRVPERRLVAFFIEKISSHNEF